MKALLCDFDGTIVNTLWLYPKAYDIPLRKFGFIFSDAEIIAKCFGRSEEAICADLGIPEHVEEFKKLYFAATESFSSKSQLFPEVVETLRYMKEKGMVVGVISFAYRWYLERMLPALKIKDFFDVIIGFDDIANPKPAPDGVFAACEKLGIDPEDAAVIGDSKTDIFMGKGAGAKTILFLPKENEIIHNFTSLKQTNPDYIITSWSELKSIL